MLTRILMAILFVLGWLIISRLIRFLMTPRRRSGPSGGSEISGKWEVVRPIGQFDPKQLQTLREMLGILEIGALQRIATPLEVAHRTVRGPRMDPEEVRGLISEPEEAQEEGLFDGDQIIVNAWLTLAADRLRDLRPDLSDYQSRRKANAAYHAAFPNAQEILFQPEPRMDPIPNAPPPPGIDPRYMHFFNIDAAFYQDPVYRSLCAMEPQELPDGAMLPLLHLVYADGRKGRQEGIPIEELLVRYGERLYPAVIEYLCFPERYEPSRETIYAGLMFDLIGGWRQPYAEPLFRAALESGWNECVRALPQASWAEKLISTFADSPYGAPVRAA